MENILLLLKEPKNFYILWKYILTLKQTAKYQSVTKVHHITNQFIDNDLPWMTSQYLTFGGFQHKCPMHNELWVSSQGEMACLLHSRGMDIKNIGW